MVCDLIFKQEAEYEGSCLGNECNICYLCFVICVKIIDTEVSRVLIVKPIHHSGAAHNYDERISVSPS